MPDKTVGLDIGEDAIKAVQVTGGLRGYQVSACGMVEIASSGDLEKALENLRQALPINGSSCVSSFPAGRVSFRNLILPFKDKKKIAQIIGYELEPMLPFSVESLTTDYVASAGGEQTPVLAASVAHASMEQHLSFLGSHNLDPDVVDVSGAALASQWARQHQDVTSALLIDVGAKTSTAVLILEGTVALVRPFHFGGHDLTNAVAESKKIGVAEAEALKRGPEGPSLAEVVKPLVAAFGRDIRNTLHAFRCQVTEKGVPERILLTGGGSLFPGMAAMLKPVLGQDIEVLDLKPELGLTFEGAAVDNWDPHRMNAALALALRDTKQKNSFNFRVGRFKKQKRYEQFRTEIRRIVIYLSVLLVVLAAQFGADYYVLQRQKNALEEQMMSVFKKAFPDVTRVVDPVHQMKVKIREVKETLLLPDDALIQKPVVDILRDIALRVPKAADLDVSSLVVDEDKVRLKGLTDTFNTVDGIKNGVQESGLFKDVAIASAQLDRNSGKVRFELVMGRQ